MKTPLQEFHAPPYVHDSDSVSRIMSTVLIALVPAGIWGVLQFGWQAAVVVAASVTAAQLTEIGLDLIKGQKYRWDGSACVSGLLLAYTLPPRFPVGLAALGGFGAVAIRGLFGGLGKNWLNPALTSRLLLGCLFPQAMLHFIAPRFGTVSGIEAVTGATPLAVFHSAKLVLAGSAAQSADIVTQSAQTVYRLYASTGDCMLGLRAGAIGETSAVCLLAGAFFLFYRRIVGIRVPFIILATTALLVWVFGGIESLFSGDPLFHLFNGGLLLGALFMATDPVTSPGKPIGKIVFGLGCGALTYFFRSWMGTEGVGYAILIMNLTKPVFDR